MTNGITARKLALRLLAALSALCAALALAVLLPGDARTAHAAESGHAEHGADWAELSAEGGELAAGKYCLAADVKLTEDLLVSGEVTLCLNGYILTGTGTGPVIMVESGADFTLCDCREGAADVANEINGVTYNSGVITGGTVTGNEATESYGSGVYINKGSFTMEGGYFGANLLEGKEDSASVSVTGGYFAEDPESCIAVGSIDETAYAVVSLSEADDCGDGDYIAGYSYAVYRLADASGYGVADIETVYGAAYAPEFSGAAENAEVSYSWQETSGEGASANDAGAGLPQNAGVYAVTAVCAIAFKKGKRRVL